MDAFFPIMGSTVVVTPANQQSTAISITTGASGLRVYNTTPYVAWIKWSNNPVSSGTPTIADQFSIPVAPMSVEVFGTNTSTICTVAAVFLNVGETGKIYFTKGDGV